MVAVTDNFPMVGTVPAALIGMTINAVESVPSSVFTYDTAENAEVTGFDDEVQRYLTAQGWIVGRSSPLFEGRKFSADISCFDQRFLIEIEKGKQPRLELDILKMVCASQLPKRHWRYGILVCPSNYVSLRLEGGDTPAAYLRRLSSITERGLRNVIDGIHVVAYQDPRGSTTPSA
jgi:hypothetical protein